MNVYKKTKTNKHLTNVIKETALLSRILQIIKRHTVKLAFRRVSRGTISQRVDTQGKLSQSTSTTF